MPLSMRACLWLEGNRFFMGSDDSIAAPENLVEVIKEAENKRVEMKVPVIHQMVCRV